VKISSYAYAQHMRINQKRILEFCIFQNMLALFRWEKCRRMLSVFWALYAYDEHTLTNRKCTLSVCIQFVRKCTACAYHSKAYAHNVYDLPVYDFFVFFCKHMLIICLCFVRECRVHAYNLCSFALCIRIQNVCVCSANVYFRKNRI